MNRSSRSGRSTVNCHGLKTGQSLALGWLGQSPFRWNPIVIGKSDLVQGSFPDTKHRLEYLGSPPDTQWAVVTRPWTSVPVPPAQLP
jgi:hypothetical protein